MKTPHLLTAGLIALALAGTSATSTNAQPAGNAMAQRCVGAQNCRIGIQDLQTFHGPSYRTARSYRNDTRKGGMSGRRGGMSGRRGGDMFRTLFGAVDADNDGRVTKAEIDDYRAKRIAQADTSGDGGLSIEEFDTLHRQLTRPRMVDAFQALDADGNGVISVQELDSRMARFMQRMDPDGDGVLTLRSARR